MDFQNGGGAYPRLTIVGSGCPLLSPSANHDLSGPPEVVRIGYRLDTTNERSQGLKPNYQYEKRQRELEKKKKKAEKEQKKASTAETPPAPETAVPAEEK